MAKHLDGHWSHGVFFPGGTVGGDQAFLAQGLVGAAGGLDAFFGLAPGLIETNGSASAGASSAIPPLDLTALGEFQFTRGSSGSGHVVVQGPLMEGGNVAFVTVSQGPDGELIVSSGSEAGVVGGPNGGATLVGANVGESLGYDFNFQPDSKNPGHYTFEVDSHHGSTQRTPAAKFFHDVTVLGWNSDSILLSFAGDGSHPAGDIVISTEDMSKLAGSIPANVTFTTTGPAPVILGTTVPEVPCFAAGTLLATPDGERPVEQLRPGDLVLTEAGRAVPIVWAGARSVACHAHPRPHRILPVRIRAHAFGPGLPVRDLVLSPDHAILWEGVLIPVCELIDGRAIVQDDVHSIRYHHIELALHDVLLAEGLPCESFLDIGNHGQFEDAGRSEQGGHSERGGHPDFAVPVTALAWEAACAPLCLHGPRIDSARARLASYSRLGARAGERALAA